MNGAGRDRGAFTEWSVNTGTTPLTWIEVTSGGNAAGYQTLSTSTMRWGINTVSAADVWVSSVVSTNVVEIRGLATTFNFIEGDEAQAVVGDSGGAVFRKNGADWELIGMMFGVAG